MGMIRQHEAMINRGTMMAGKAVEIISQVRKRMKAGELSAPQAQAEMVSQLNAQDMGCLAHLIGTLKIASVEEDQIPMFSTDIGFLLAAIYEASL